ncbi:MAG: alpha-glucoside transport system substrate-binding protein [Gaiellaceae bacterium]|nr:alpha-glucoside transport system substrate-binding protein [Gaiellaceae bacterium]
MKAPNKLVIAALLGVVMLAAVTAFASANSTKKSVSGTVSIVGVWTGPEEQAFNAVLDGFKKANPDVNVSYKSTGDNTPTVLATAVAGGNPPDLAAVSQPGLVSDFQKKGALKNIDYAKAALTQNYPPDIAKLGVISGHVYGFLIKGANKSTVWYNAAAFKNAGVSHVGTWAQFLKAAKTLKASGTPAFSIGGADGWTLTDLFENIYLRQAGPAKYDLLSKHKIKWTDKSVVAALKTMGAVLQSSNMAGGTSGALQTDFPTSVSNVFADAPKAAMVIEGDFVPGVVAGKNPLKPVSGYNVFPFPVIGTAKNYVEGGGDMLMAFKDTPAIRSLVQYLATGEAQTIWAKLGGYTAPAKTVSPSAYPDAITRTTAAAVGKAKVFRFDLSDLQPASFGGTVGQGEFKLFQDFLKSPKNATGIAKQLESAAAKAYKAGK